jgi:hypothetical protein
MNNWKPTPKLRAWAKKFRPDLHATFQMMDDYMKCTKKYAMEAPATVEGMLREKLANQRRAYRDLLQLACSVTSFDWIPGSKDCELAMDRLRHHVVLNFGRVNDPSKKP